MSTDFPARYEPIAPLGKGGGGEVWSVRDRITGEVLAWKSLGDRAEGEEHQALVREASALSGLDGFGSPRVVSFGRSPREGRPYLVRELAEGRSLQELLRDRSRVHLGLRAILHAAEQLTLLHRAQLLHGDVKPANIIVSEDGSATWVDLGLVTQLREGGVRPVGLTVLYAAPELLEGRPLTVRAEVFALGATLRDVLLAAGGDLTAEARDAIEAIALRATSANPDARYPSVEELSEALRSWVRDARPKASGQAAWPVLGVDEISRELERRVRGLPEGGGLALTGRAESGRTTLLARLAWTLAIDGGSVAHLEPKRAGDAMEALAIELAGKRSRGTFILVDDAALLGNAAWALLSARRAEGARFVVVSDRAVPLEGPTCEVFEVPSLGADVALELAARTLPSYGKDVRAHVVARASGVVGRLRAIVEKVRTAPVVVPADVDQLLDGDDADEGPVSIGSIRALLERGHFERAAASIGALDGVDDPELSVLRGKLLLNQGLWREALTALASAEPSLADEGRADLAGEHAVETARAHLRGGQYARSEEFAKHALGRLPDEEVTPGSSRKLHARVELLAIVGLCRSFLGDHAEAKRWLEDSVALADRLAEPRSLTIAKGSLAFALQRAGDLEAAGAAYGDALTYAEQAGDAGAVATARLNLAGVAKSTGDIAQSLAHLEAAVDMAKKSGRRSTLRQSLLNLANLDLYLGRLERARSSIDELDTDRLELAPHVAAQLDALSAELAHKSGDHESALRRCDACMDAYLALGRPVDAAEALIEGAFFTLADERGKDAERASAATERLERAESLLAGAEAHKPALLLARARVAMLRSRDEATRLVDLSVAAADKAQKREWLARALATRAEVREEDGQRLLARKDREAALTIFEEIAARLPRDLREVFWNERSRRALREADLQATRSTHASAPLALAASELTVSRLPVREERLSRILAINREIAGTYDLRQLLDRVTDHAIQLLSAERGFVILRSSKEGSAPHDFSIHASRDQSGGDVHARFSQSIAERVIGTGEPFVTTSARDDKRMADFVSVHQLMLQSIACVPIRSRTHGTIGALYVETRLQVIARFQEELAVLGALADQVGIAIETARLVSENERRARELERANDELTKAHGRLEELLGHRTAQLQATRRDLKSARAVLKSHFGYQGLVGTSEAQRKLYALIDRIKDTDVPVLIVGESGTGKEVVARAIHNASPRAKSPFLGLNCGAIPEHLLESELFGHTRGAFTGADRDRKGLFREATEGTLLLDEIGEMPQKMQAGLLRVLQEKVVRPVGGAREEPVNTRVIAATHRDLESMVERGAFREDLFYRLNVIQVRVPPLRDRTEDIPVLIDHFLGIFAARYNRERRSVSRGALKMLMAQRWPGNVRQLENALLNAWVLSEGPELMTEDFELSTEPRPSMMATPDRGAPSSRGGAAPTSLDLHKADERERIVQALSSCNWNRVRAAELIGMPRRTFYRRLKDYGIQ